MDAKDLYLYKVSAKHTPDVYVAAYNQREAVEKVKDKGNVCVCTEGPVFDAEQLW